MADAITDLHPTSRILNLKWIQKKDKSRQEYLKTVLIGKFLWLNKLVSYYAREKAKKCTSKEPIDNLVQCMQVLVLRSDNDTITDDNPTKRAWIAK